MTSMVTVRNIPEEDKLWLKREAERMGTSMEAVVRALIAAKREAETPREKPSELARRLFGPENGFEFEPPKLKFGLRVPDFSSDEYGSTDEV